MKVFFDTNVYVAEALLGEAAEQMLEATSKASWRIFTDRHVLDEIERVLLERLDASRRFAHLTRMHVKRRATLVEAAAEVAGTSSPAHRLPGRGRQSLPSRLRRPFLTLREVN